MKRWGKAGVRLTEEQIRQRDGQRVMRAAADRAALKQDDAVTRRLWAAGEVKPYRITLALNSKALYGPKVDVACGAREPDVDLWEAGKLYPTWNQLVALAELCGVTPRFFCMGDPPFRVEETTLRFHLPPVPEPPIVWAFDPSAVAAAVTS